MTVNLSPDRARRTVEIATEFPGSAVPDLFERPSAMTLNQKGWGHDVASLVFNIDLKDPRRLLRTGSPVRIRWSTTGNNDVGEWIGYVIQVSPRRDSDTAGQTEVTCVSPSMILKQASQRAWSGLPVSTVMSEIVTSFGLNADVAEHPLVSTVLAAGRTYWEVLRDLSRLLGHGLSVDGVTVRSRPHRWYMDQYSARAQVFHTGESLDLPVNLSTRTLYSLRPDFGEYTDDDWGLHAAMTAWSLDPATGKVVGSEARAPSAMISMTREDPLVRRYEHRVSHSSGDADRLAHDALAARRWINQATLYGTGTPYLAPFKPVYVDGYSDAADGWWQILSVEHEITSRSEYAVRMRLGMDGNGWNYPKPAAIPFIPAAQMANTQRVSPVFISRASATSGTTGFGDVGGRWTALRSP